MKVAASVLSAALILFSAGLAVAGEVGHATYIAVLTLFMREAL